MGETKQLTFERAGAMPARTWHVLNMNDARIAVPEGLAIEPRVQVNGASQASGEAGGFDDALAGAQAAWEQEHPEPTAEEVAEREAFLAAEADATYGGTAQSDYQVAADALEEARSLAMAFENGLGDEAAAYVRYAAGERVVVQADPGQEVDAQVVVGGAAGTFSAAAVDVVAGAGAAVNLSVVVAGAEGGVGAGGDPFNGGSEHIVDADGRTSEDGAGEPARAFTGTTLRVFAGEDARVNIVRTQALGPGFTDLDDMGLFAGERARIDVMQTVLGASETFTGLACDLRGAASRIDIHTRYLGRDDQSHDFNYIVRHHGERTECDLQANGVLAGASSKTLRGTIDLIRGAKGAQGNENETVLLVDEGVHNKTVPVILCNEDDVAGNHGATIGHVREEQLFYLQSRGISREAAERMFVSALVEQSAIDAPDAQARAAVVHLGEQIAPGLFNE